MLLIAVVLATQALKPQPTIAIAQFTITFTFKMDLYFIQHLHLENSKKLHNQQQRILSRYKVKTHINQHHKMVTRRLTLLLL